MICDNGKVAINKSPSETIFGVIASEDLTKNNNTFRIKVCKMGTFLAIGIAEKSISLACTEAVGLQQNVLSCGYTSTNRESHISMKDLSKPAKRIQKDDVIDVLVDFDSQRVCFWRNATLEGVIQSRFPLDEGVYRPTVLFNCHDSEIKILPSNPLELPVATSSSSGTICGDCIVNLLQL
jgi:hypothetical protein